MKFTILPIGFMFPIAARAQPYPNRPVKFVVPFPPGGNLDFVARTLQPKMAEVLGDAGTIAINIPVYAKVAKEANIKAD